MYTDDRFGNHSSKERIQNGKWFEECEFNIPNVIT